MLIFNASKREKINPYMKAHNEVELKKLMNVNKEYTDALNAYMRAHNMQNYPSILDNPVGNFVYYNDAVHYIYSRSLPLYNDIEVTFKNIFNLPCTDECKIEKQLLKALKNLCVAFSRLPRYLLIIDSYEKKYNCQFPVFDFWIIDGVFCYCHIDSSYLPRFEVLNMSFFRYIDSSSFWKDILPVLRMSRFKKDVTTFEYVRSDNPYYMYIKNGRSIKSLKYDRDTRSFLIKDCIYNNLSDLHNAIRICLPTLRNTDISNLFHYTSCNIGLWKDLQVTQRLTDFLYAFSNERYENFINLSILFANIVSPELLTPKLFLVTYSCNERGLTYTFTEIFCWILNFIFDKDVGDINLTFTSIGKAVLKKNITFFPQYFLKGKKTICIEQGTTKLTDQQQETLLKYIKGIKCSGADTKMGKVYFRNTSPIICFCNTHEEVAYLERKFPCIRINLESVQNNTFLNILNPEENIIEYEWLRVYMPLYGLYLLAEKKYYKAPISGNRKTSKSISDDDVINDFLDYCCRRSTNGFVYADVLYTAYTFYFHSTYGGQPLKRSQFVAILKQSMYLEYKRPHVSRNVPNKYAFIGIDLKDDWQKEIKPDANQSNPKEVFKSKLQEITDLMSKTIRF